MLSTKGRDKIAVSSRAGEEDLDIYKETIIRVEELLCPATAAPPPLQFRTQFESQLTLTPCCHAYSLCRPPQLSECCRLPGIVPRGPPVASTGRVGGMTSVLTLAQSGGYIYNSRYIYTDGSCRYIYTDGSCRYIYTDGSSRETL